MALVTTFALTLGPSIAKAILKVWVKDIPVAEDLLPDLIDILRDTVTGDRERSNAASEIEKIGQGIATRMRPFFDNEAEAKRLSQEDRVAVAREIAETLSRAQISAELVVAAELRRDQLERYLRTVRPDATHTLSGRASEIYDRMLVEASIEIVEVVTELAGYERHFGTRVLENLSRIIDYLEIPNSTAVEFDRTYRNSLARRLDRTEIIGQPQLNQPVRHQTLSEAYVPLCAEWLKVDQEINNNEPALLKALLGLDEQGAQKDIIDKLLINARRFIIYGDAGSGKSTLLQWIGVRAAKQEFSGNLENWNKCVPFFISLRGRPDQDIPAGLPLPERFPAIAAPAIAGGMPDGWVHQQLRSGLALVLVDGIDELPYEQRRATLERLSDLVADFPDARYIISSRSSVVKASHWPEWNAWTVDQKFVNVGLLPMASEQVNLFVERWHQALTYVIFDEEERAELPQLAVSLQQLLDDRPSLKHLATTPLLCAMICALHREHRQNLPNEHNNLYRECIKMLLSRDAARGIDYGADYPILSDSQKLALLQSFAYWMMRNDLLDADTGDVDQRFKDKLPSMTLQDNVTGEQVRQYFIERTGLLRLDENRITFTHQTFKVFLAAQQAVDEGDINLLKKNALHDQWRDMIVLAAGLANQRDRLRLLNGLVTKGKRLKRQRARQHMQELLIDCLENCVVLPPEVRQYIQEEANILGAGDKLH